MANHKRKRPKNRRAGCLLCKPHKGNGFKGSLNQQTIQEQKAIEWADIDIEEYWLEQGWNI